MSAALATSLAFLPACTTAGDGQAEVATDFTGTTETAGSQSTEYASLLFDDSRVHEIDVSIADEDWTDLLDHPSEKTKYEASVTIDGETVDKVSFATKGNSSLTNVISDEGSNRYGFKVNFGKYVDGQTYHGLDKLNLSNIYADATYMKDYISYELFRQVGVDAPLTSYVWLKVNGDDFGLYLAVEEMSDSYLERTQNGQGELYKPEGYEMDGNKGKKDADAGNKGNNGKDANTDADSEDTDKDGKQQDANAPSDTPSDDDAKVKDEAKTDNDDSKDATSVKAPTDGKEQADDKVTDKATGTSTTTKKGSRNGRSDIAGFGQGMPDMAELGDRQRPKMPGGMGRFMGFGGGDDAATLAYVDDNPESYSIIFDNDETDADEESNKRVIAALKSLSEGQPEKALDTEEVISYFVAHNFVLNYDSYTGTMTHNYYLYEKDGKLSMLPWDYNLAFGGFGMDGGTGDKMETPFADKSPSEKEPEKDSEKTAKKEDSKADDKASDKTADKTSSKVDVKDNGKDDDKKATAGETPSSPKAPESEYMSKSAEATNDASELVNMGIDSPLSIPDDSESSRPMWQWIQNDEKYVTQYHEKYDELITDYFESGEFEKKIDATYEMIRPYVEKDQTAFYTVDEFDDAYETLRSFCLLRAESIRRQLDGKLATKTSEQDEADRVDTTGISTSAMGRQMESRKGADKKSDDKADSESDDKDAETDDSKDAKAGDKDADKQHESQFEGDEDDKIAGKDETKSDSTEEKATISSQSAKKSKNVIAG